MKKKTKGQDRLAAVVAGKYSLVAVVSWEEGRVEAMLKSLAATGLAAPVPFAMWTCVDGLTSGQGANPTAPGIQSGSDPATRELTAALEVALETAAPGVFLFKDVVPYLDRPEVVRKLRDVYALGREQGQFFFLLSPRLVVPTDLKKEIYILEVDLPGEEEILAYLQKSMTQFLRAGNMTAEDLSHMALSLKGMTLNEITHLLQRLFRGRKTFDASVMQEIFSEKEQMSKKEGILEFVPPRFGLEDVGGLGVLKDWLERRRHLFTRDALAAGIPIPKGVLLMGMSGCGKSLAVKVVSTTWNLPLFRLDMNQVFSGSFGSPEAVFHRALKSVEAVAPAVLWIDEIEMSVAGYREGDSGSSAHIFSSFLTWMQEKDAMVFVAATANRIKLLPAEIIRKGRFDQVFFIDLPGEEERKQIFEIHLRKNGGDLAKFDLVLLSAATRGWNGAEIEQAVIAARVDAYSENRVMTEQDLLKNTSSTVPLSTTMDEQIRAIKSWAHNRAVNASGKRES